jgi:hypothetical protein
MVLVGLPNLCRSHCLSEKIVQIVETDALPILLATDANRNGRALAVTVSNPSAPKL